MRGSIGRVLQPASDLERFFPLEQLAIDVGAVHTAPQLHEVAASAETLDAARGIEPAQRMSELFGATRALGPAFAELDLVLVGQGSVGMPLTLWAAQVGVGSVVAVDRAAVKPTSLLTHPVTPEEIGQPKARVAGRRARALRPQTRVYVFEGDVEDLPVHVMANASAILLASDNLACEIAVAQRALHLGVPVLQGSVHGGTLTAQVRAVHGGNDGSGPGLCCGFGPAEWAHLDAATTFSCVGDGAGRTRPAGVPTTSPAFLCSAAAALTFLELTRRAAGLVPFDSSWSVGYTGLGQAIHTTRLERRDACPLDHQRYTRAATDAQLALRTPRELLRAADAADADLRRVTFQVDGQRFASHAACGCDPRPTLGRFLPRGVRTAFRGLPTCERCARPLAPHPMHVHEEVPASLLETLLDERLSALGVSTATSVRVRTDTRTTLFASPLPEKP
jgi:hypothetical protein